jgi:hypothetical protein
MPLSEMKEAKEPRKKKITADGSLHTSRFKSEDALMPDDMAALRAEASRNIEELAKQIHRCCSDKKGTGDQKREACWQLVRLAGLSTKKMLHLATEFPEPFREIARAVLRFPVFFPGARQSPVAYPKVFTR